MGGGTRDGALDGIVAFRTGRRGGEGIAIEAADPMFWEDGSRDSAGLGIGVARGVGLCARLGSGGFGEGARSIAMGEGRAFVVELSSREGGALSAGSQDVGSAMVPPIEVRLIAGGITGGSPSLLFFSFGAVTSGLGGEARRGLEGPATACVSNIPFNDLTDATGLRPFWSSVVWDSTLGSLRSLLDFGGTSGRARFELCSLLPGSTESL
jgi:hypothetical protein